MGGGIGMGKTCEPKTFSFQCMTEFTTNKKNKKIKIKWMFNPKKKKEKKRLYWENKKYEWKLDK